VLGESDETWDKERREFFFDRHPGIFSMVMHYYRTEELHIDQNFCGNIIQGVGNRKIPFIQASSTVAHHKMVA